MIKFSDVLETITDAQPPLTIPVGVTADETLKCLDLAKAPHILFAGATGSGKSVGLNSSIATLMKRNTPKTLRFTMIDPKRVELASYRASKFVDAVITDMDEAAEALESVLKEMESRYRLLEGAEVKNIAEYNALGEDQLTYQVLVVDELADLMDTHEKTVLPILVRLGQLARAAGIHMMLATQRPAADTTPKKLVSNIPTRISFMTQSAVESRIIIGAKGAEDLAGNGELLAQLPGTKGIVKAQGPFISGSEIDEIVALNKRTDAKPKVPDVHEFVSPAAEDGPEIGAAETVTAVDQAETIGVIVAQLAEQMELSSRGKIEAAEAERDAAKHDLDTMGDDLAEARIELATLKANHAAKLTAARDSAAESVKIARKGDESRMKTNDERVARAEAKMRKAQMAQYRYVPSMLISGAIATLIVTGFIMADMPWVAIAVPFLASIVSALVVTNVSEPEQPTTKEEANGKYLRPGTPDGHRGNARGNSPARRPNTR